MDHDDSTAPRPGCARLSRIRARSPALLTQSRPKGRESSLFAAFSFWPRRAAGAHLPKFHIADHFRAYGSCFTRARRSPATLKERSARSNRAPADRAIKKVPFLDGKTPSGAALGSGETVNLGQKSITTREKCDFQAFRRDLPVVGSRHRG
jgi:hypothetical protein